MNDQSEPIKACKDCRHSIENEYGGWKSPHCTHPNVGRMMIDRFHLGLPPVHGGYYLCLTVRQPVLGKCGPEARLFEAREGR